MVKKIKLKIKKENIGLRLDHFLVKKLPAFSRSQIQKKIEKDQILVNQEKTESSCRLVLGDEIVISFIPTNKTKLESLKINLDIIYEDKDIIVVDKPAGLVTHPGSGHIKDTLVNAFLDKIKYRDAKFPLRSGIVHRLDKDTSGILIIAKNEKVYNYFADQFKKQKVIKKYLALVQGHMLPKKGIIEAPISRSNTNRQKMTICMPGKGKNALTVYKVIKYFDQLTLLELSPKTGRTHQIRVHLASIGYPLIGDKTYGSRSSQKAAPRQFLHAYYLAIKLPSGRDKEFKSELPSDLQNVLIKYDKLTNRQL